MNTLDRIKLGAGLLLVLALGAGGYVAWKNYQAVPPAGGDSVPAVVAPVLKKATIVPVKIKAPVKTYQGATKANLKLPPLVIADEHKQVISASRVAPDLHPQTVTTVINTETGTVESFTKTEPYPWLAVETRGEASILYGYKFKTGELGAKPVGRLQIKYDVLRVKALTLGAVASIDSDRDGFVGIGMSYKW